MEPNEQQAAVTLFQQRIEEVKAAYEQYFLGNERLPPQKEYDDLIRMMHLLERESIRNSTLRFRLQSLVARLNSYRNYWNRILRQIEDGTYQRDISRLRRKLAKDGIELPQNLKNAADIERALLQSKTADPSMVRGKPADELRRDSKDQARAEKRDTHSSASIPDEELQSLFRRFLKAKKMCGEDTSAVRYDTLVKSISQQLPKIKAQHQCDDVEFQVVIRQGRAILKAQPKKKEARSS